MLVTKLLEKVTFQKALSLLWDLSLLLRISEAVRNMPKTLIYRNHFLVLCSLLEIFLISAVKVWDHFIAIICIRDKLIWQKWEFLYCHKNLGLNDQDRKIYGIIFICCHIGNYPPWNVWWVKQLIIYLYLNSNYATFLT